MSQADLNRAVAAATGESIATIARRGFSLVDSVVEPSEPDSIPAPLVVDWDELDSRRHAL